MRIVAAISTLLSANTSANNAKNQKENEMVKAIVANSEEKKFPSESSVYLVITYRQIKK